MQISKTSNQPAAGRRKKTRRPSFRHWWKKARPLTFVLLCVIAAVMLIPIVFTFLYSFFPTIGDQRLSESAQQLRHIQVAAGAVLALAGQPAAVLQNSN